MCVLTLSVCLTYPSIHLLTHPSIQTKNCLIIHRSWLLQGESRVWNYVVALSRGKHWSKGSLFQVPACLSLTSLFIHSKCSKCRPRARSCSGFWQHRHTVHWLRLSPARPQPCLWPLCAVLGGEGLWGSESWSCGEWPQRGLPGNVRLAVWPRGEEEFSGKDWSVSAISASLVELSERGLGRTGQGTALG